MWCASRVIFAWWCVKHNQGQHPCQHFWQHVSCSTSLWCTFGWLWDAAGFFLHSCSSPITRQYAGRAAFFGVDVPRQFLVDLHG
jgi:hypothetical protein